MRRGAARPEMSPMKKLLATSAAALAATVFLTSCSALDNPSKAGTRLAEDLLAGITNEDADAVEKTLCSNLSYEAESLVDDADELRPSVSQPGKAFMNPDEDNTFVQVFILDVQGAKEGDFQSTFALTFRQKADKSWCIQRISESHGFY